MKMELRDKNGQTEKEFLENYRAGDYPRPSVTADILIFAFSDLKTELLLIRRGGHPFLGMWALPGGFVNPDESADEAAKRELKEETQVDGIFLEHLGVFSEPKRDPRTWVITCAYLALAEKSQLRTMAGDDADDVNWFEVALTPKDDQSVMQLTLRSAESVLSAVLHVRQTKTAFGIQTEIDLVSSEGIAFGHAKIIATGLLRLDRLKKGVSGNEATKPFYAL